MNKNAILADEIKNAVLDVYLGTTHNDLQQIATKYELPLSAIQLEWQSLHRITSAYRALPQQQPSRHIQHQILSYAESNNQQHHAAGVLDRLLAKMLPLWRLTIPNFGITLRPSHIATLAIFGLSIALLTHSSGPPATHVAFTQTTPSDSAVRTRGLQTPLDFHEPKLPSAPSFFTAQPSLTQPASLQTANRSFDEDTDLDRKILTRSLNAKDADALFFRARKFEHLGYYSQALQDYQYITQFYPAYENRKAVELAIATCLEGLKQKSQAIGVLQHFEDEYGPSEEINLWIDQLKSETF